MKVISVMIETIIFIGILFLAFSRKKTKSKLAPKSNAIIGYGRSPVFYDLMEEEYAPLKAKLQEDAKNGVIYKKRKMSLQQLLNGEEGEEYEQTAEDALREFENYENNGYM